MRRQLLHGHVVLLGIIVVVVYVVVVVVDVGLAGLGLVDAGADLGRGGPGGVGHVGGVRTVLLLQSNLIKQ